MTSHHRGYRWYAGVGFAATTALALLLAFGPRPSYGAETPVDLNTAANFSVLAGSAVSNTGATTLAQDLGVHPGAAASGFPPGTVAGEIHLADGVALQAKTHLTNAYVDAAGRTPFTSLPAELGGSTLIPGVYRIGAAQLTGQLTLDSQNDPAAVFIFQVSSTLITASNSDVVFINGASPCNVFWQVTSSATLGTNSDFVGNIMALTSITMNTGATLAGRALARNGAVTLDDNVITAPVCAAATSAPGTSAPATGAPGTSGPATGAPATSGPATGAPATSAPATSGPAGSAPATTAPVSPSTARPPGAGPPVDVPTTPTWPTEPPELSRTGSSLAPTLSFTGIVLIALGVAIVLLCRRRRIDL